MMSEYKDMRIQALELELKASRLAFAQYNPQLSEEAALDILDRAVQRIKVELNQENDGETSI
jgi:hypothetical protein